MSRDERWIWGRHPVLEALRAARVDLVLIASGRRDAAELSEIQRLAGLRGVQVAEASPERIHAIAPDENTQGVAARLAAERPVDLAGVLAAVGGREAPAPFIAALDQVQDPHNMGAIIRTANAVGVDAVLVPARRSASLTGVVAKTSAGAIHHTTVVEVVNLARALDHVRAAGIWTIGLDVAGSRAIYDSDLRGPVCVVVGSEGDGLRRLTRDKCDLLVRLPMRGTIETLNASVAASIAMYEVLRQRDYA